MGKRTFFLDGPLVVIWSLGLLDDLPSPTLFISMIFFVGSLGNASRSLRMFLALHLAAWTKDLFAGLALPVFLSFFLSSLAFLSASGNRRGGIGGEIFKTHAGTEPMAGLGVLGD